MCKLKPDELRRLAEAMLEAEGREKARQEEVQAAVSELEEIRGVAHHDLAGVLREENSDHRHDPAEIRTLASSSPERSTVGMILPEDQGDFPEDL
jgi:hypothetical protein